MYITHNLNALNAQRQYDIITNRKSKSFEKLASGYRVNRAADNAAGLCISEKMRGQIRGMTQGVENTQDGISLCQVADGALAEVTNMIHRITELTIQAANDTNTELDKQHIQDEISQLLKEIDEVGDRTNFNGKKIFDGSMSSVKNGSLTNISYEEAKKQMLTGNYFCFFKEKVSINGTEVSAMEVNAYIACLSQYVIEDDIYTRGLNYAGPNNQMTIELMGSLKNVIDVNYDIVEGDKSSSYYKQRIDSLDKAKKVLESASTISARQLYDELSMVFFPGSQNEGGMYEAFYTHSVSGLAAHVFGYLSTLHGEAYDYSQGQTTSSYFQYGEANKINSIGYKGMINKALGGGEIYGNIDVDSQHDAVSQYMELIKIGQQNEVEDDNQGFYIQSGANSREDIAIDIGEMNVTVLGITDIDVSNANGVKKALEAEQVALQRVSSNRSKIGAQQNRLEYTVKNGLISAENMVVAESRIRDVNMAEEITEMSKVSILEQVGHVVMAQANQSNQSVLGLLQ